MPVFNNALAGAAGSGGAGASYTIQRSLRFNAADSAYLNRQPSSQGNRTTWTWSGWVKRTVMGADKFIFSAGTDASNFHYLRFKNDDKLEITEKISDQVQYSLITSARYRDPSAWYHIVYNYDSGQSTAADRMCLYVNGVKVTDFGTSSYPSQNHSSNINSQFNHLINARPNPAGYADQYLAEIHFVDGQALAATDFGEFDDNGVWQPKEVSGVTYGTNGFHLDFSDNSSNAALGTDSSGNNNTWTVNNLTASVPTYTATAASGALDSSIFDGSNTKTYWQTSITITGITVASGAAFGYRGVIETGNSTPSHTITKNGTEIGSFSGTVGNNNWAASTNYTVNQGTISQAIGPSDTVTITTDVQAWHGADQITINGSPIVQASPAGIDSLIDSPTAYEVESGNNGGNYATLNPLHNGQTLSNGNLDVVGTSSWQRSVSTIAMSSGQWYWEYEITASNEHIIGVGTLDMQLSGNLGAGSPPGSGYGTELGQVNGTGANSSWTNTGGSTAGDVIGVAFDADAGKMYIYKNGTALNSGIPSHTGLIDGPYYAVFSLNGSSRSGSVNFGQRPFKYNNPGTNRPAATYLSLCTQNLPDPLIKDGSAYFDTRLWTGNGTSKTIGEQVYSSGALTGSIDSGNPITRGFDGSTSTGTWAGSSAGFELTFPNPVTVASSITVIGGSSTTNYKVIVDGTEHTITFPNGSSSYTQEVTVNVSGSFTGIKGTSNHGELRGIKVDGDMLIDGAGEPLSFSPDLVWTKQRNGAGFHALFDTTRGVHNALRTHSTGSTYTDTGLLTAFNSDGFSIGSAGDINGNNNTYVGFAWDGGDLATNSDYNQTNTWSSSSSFASTTGFRSSEPETNAFDGNTDSICSAVGNGVVTFTSPVTFSSSSTIKVFVHGGDHTVTVNGGADQTVAAGSFQTITFSNPSASTFTITFQRDGSADTGIRAIEIGGKILVDTGVIPVNSLTSSTYNTSQDWSTSGNNMQNNWSASFDGDMSDFALPNTGYSASMTFPSAISYSTLELVVSRDIYAPDLLMNGNALNVPATDSNTIGGQYKIERFTFSNGTLTSIGHNTRNTAGRGGSGFWQIIVDGKILVDSSQTPPTLPASPSTVRANPTAGFSIVTYTGSGSATSIAHGLNAAPEMIILKGRDFADDWRIYHKDIHNGEPEDYYLQFSTNTRSGDQNASFMNDTKPTSTVFSLGTDSAINGSGNSMLAYCFTSIPGYSLLGSYVGTGTNVFVHCGFRPAFIMLKKIDGVDKWGMYDTARGTFNTLETQLYPNEVEAESGDYFNFDILSNGFRPMDNSGQVNETGKNYIFYAVAENPFKYARAR